MTTARKEYLQYMKESCRNTSIIRSLEVEKRKRLRQKIEELIKEIKFVAPLPYVDEGPFAYVYFISNEEYTKIGYVSGAIFSRLANLQTASSQKLEVDCLVPIKGSKNARRAESLLHSFFSKYHVRGEWFALQGSEEYKTFKRIINQKKEICE